MTPSLLRRKQKRVVEKETGFDTFSTYNTYMTDYDSNYPIVPYQPVYIEEEVRKKKKHWLG